VTFLANRLSI